MAPGGVAAPADAMAPTLSYAIETEPNSRSSQALLPCKVRGRTCFRIVLDSRMNSRISQVNNLRNDALSHPGLNTIQP